MSAAWCRTFRDPDSVAAWNSSQAVPASGRGLGGASVFERRTSRIPDDKPDQWNDHEGLIESIAEPSHVLVEVAICNACR